METLFKIVEQFLPYILVIIVAIIFIMLINMTRLNIKLKKLDRKYKKLMRGTSTQNLEETIVEYLNKIESSKNIIEECNARMNNLDKTLKKCVQKVSVIRYKAFDDVGSDLSFSIALLDNNNNGLILTGIFGRNESTTYAKPVDKGISRYDLSDEEQQALNEAMAQ